VRGKRILIIDDDALLRVQVSDTLKEAEPEVQLVEAEDGEQGLAKLAAFDPQLVLLDLLMPSLSGVETLSFIRARAQPPKVVIMSSLDSESMIDNVLQAGADGFIAKPFHPLELVEIVQRHLK
jgi:two-component system, chemotaxis family, chemotaxis protein CheY